MEFVEGDVVVEVNTHIVGEVISIDPITRMIRVKWDDDVYNVTSCKSYQIQLAREYFNK